MGETGLEERKKEWEKETLKGNMCVKGISTVAWMNSKLYVCVCLPFRCVQPYSPWVCEGGRSLGDDRSRLRGGQSLLGSQAATGAHHGAMRVRVLQGMGLWVVQRRLGLWVLRLKLGFELLMLLVHTGRPIMWKRLRGGEGRSGSDNQLGPFWTIFFQLVCVLWSEVILTCVHLFKCVCLTSICLIYTGECDRLVCLSSQQVRYLRSSNWVWLLLSPSHWSVTQNATLTDLTSKHHISKVSIIFFLSNLYSQKN